ncbi:MAG: hypothetical protein RH917_03265 [Lacipirellulaceae bacterium]
MTRPLLFWFLCVFLLASAADSFASHYTYEVIDPNSNVRYGPFVANDGSVVWSGSATVDGERQSGIFRWNSGVTEQVIAQGDTFLGFSALALSDNGTIAFTASISTGGRGAYRFDAQGLTEIAVPDVNLRDAFVQDVNDQGEVLYTARTTADLVRPNELRVGTGDADRTLATIALPGGFFGGSMNNLGEVAYSIQTSAASGDIWSFKPDGSASVVSVPENFGFGRPAINDAGELAVITRLGSQSVWLYSGDTWGPLASDPEKTYFADALPTLNNRGQIVARSQAGIEVAPSPRSTVFSNNNPPMEIDGFYYTASSGFGFGRDINDRGQVVANLRRTNQFGSILTDEALVLATLVPEPSSFLLVQILLGAGVLRHRVRQTPCL